MSKLSIADAFEKSWDVCEQYGNGAQAADELKINNDDLIAGLTDVFVKIHHDVDIFDANTRKILVDLMGMSFMAGVEFQRSEQRNPSQ